MKKVEDIVNEFPIEDKRRIPEADNELFNQSKKDITKVNLIAFYDQINKYSTKENRSAYEKLYMNLLAEKYGMPTN